MTHGGAKQLVIPGQVHEVEGVPEHEADDEARWWSDGSEGVRKVWRRWIEWPASAADEPQPLPKEPQPHIQRTTGDRGKRL